MSDAYLTVSDQSFQHDVLDSEQPVIVDFWAGWCGPCLRMAPAFESLATEFQGKVRFAKLDVDENQRTSGNYGVMSIPTLILFKGGKPVGQIVGLQSREKVKQAIEQTFGVLV